MLLLLQFVIMIRVIWLTKKIKDRANCCLSIIQNLLAFYIKKKVIIIKLIYYLF